MWVLSQEKLRICCQDTEHSQSRCGKLNQQSILLSLFLQKIQKGVVMKDSCLNKFPVSRKFLITYSLVNQLECNNYLIAYGTLQRICKATHKTRTPRKKMSQTPTSKYSDGLTALTASFLQPHRRGQVTSYLGRIWNTNLLISVCPGKV